jgi:hypothetical protein
VAERRRRLAHPLGQRLVHRRVAVDDAGNRAQPDPLFVAKGGACGGPAGALIVGTLNNGGHLLAIKSFHLQIIIGR